MDEGQRCEAERSERRDEIVSEDMLRDKRGAEAKRRREVFKSERLCEVRTGGTSSSLFQ